MKPGQFRIFLALLVAFAHTAGPPIGKPAVLLFFVLSGYWISKMWQERYQYARSPYLTFAASRIWRLLPIYWVCYAITLLISLGMNRYSPAEWAMMQDKWWILKTTFLLGSASQFRVLTSAWSLDYELQFYLLAPLLVFAVPKLQGKGAATGWVLCAVLILMYAFSWHPLPQLVFHYMGYFGAGVLMQLTGWKPSATLAKYSFWLFAAGVTAVSVFFVLERMRIFSGFPMMLDLHTGRDAVIAMAGIPAALASCHVASDSWDRTLGAASYPLYLVQKFVDVFFEQLLHGKSFLLKTASLPFQWLAMLLITAALYSWIDKPIDAMRQAWVKKRSARLTLT